MLLLLLTPSLEKYNGITKWIFLKVVPQGTNLDYFELHLLLYGFKFETWSLPGSYRCCKWTTSRADLGSNPTCAVQVA